VGVGGLVGGAHLPLVTLAWYAAYGSNTDETRFRRYLAGCTATVEPLDSRPFVLDLPLYFAGTSTRWGDGGVAFASTARDAEPATLGRAWLLPIERIAEVGAQENGLPLDRAALDVDAGDHRAFPDRWYDSWISCGELDGHPVVTLTSTTDQHPRNAPGRAYLEVVARGIRTTHGLTVEEVSDYLLDRTNLPRATLIAWQEEGPG
jgi:hypothetical protein